MLQIIREAREGQIVINDPCCVVLDSDRTPRTVAVFNEPEDAELFVRAKNGMMPRPAALRALKEYLIRNFVRVEPQTETELAESHAACAVIAEMERLFKDESESGSVTSSVEIKNAEPTTIQEFVGRENMKFSEAELIQAMREATALTKFTPLVDPDGDVQPDVVLGSDSHSPHPYTEIVARLQSHAAARRLIDRIPDVKPDVFLGGEQDASKLPGGLPRQGGGS